MSKTAIALALAALGTGSALAAEPTTIDWSEVQAAAVPLSLFYPGQSSYEWPPPAACPTSCSARPY